MNACAVGPKAFALRSHVNGIVGTCADRQLSPQVPRMPGSLFPRRPTAHAQTAKSSPRPLASQKSRKTHSMEVNIHFFNQHIANRAWNDKRDVCDVQMTSRPFFFTLIHEINIRCLLLRGRSHEQGMRPWNIMVELCPGPWFD